MSGQRIAFHLTNTQPTLRPAPTRRLMRLLLAPPLSTRIPLVLHHVLQTHREHRPHENRRGHLDTRSTVIQDVITRLLQSKLTL